MNPGMANNSFRRNSVKRRGTMLAQMVVVMSCMSILITLSGTLLFRLFRQQADMTQATVQTATWSRLARDFRSDVHRAKSAKVAGDKGESLELAFPNGTVTWRADGEVVHRIHRPADSQKSVEETPGERYLCPNGAATFSVTEAAVTETAVTEAEGQGKLVELRVAPADSAKASSIPDSLLLSTALGLDRRHEGGPAE